MQPSQDIQRLIEIMQALRTPVTGCPWDIEQSFATIAPYTIEEAYEVADAIERKDLADLKDELGDLLLQVVYHARMAEEVGAFSFGDVDEAITKKMIRRHPHVFGTAEQRAAGAAPDFWAKVKAVEKGARPASAPSILADIPASLPGLTRAIKLQDKAARVGFDWPSLAPVFDKVKEELREFEEVAIKADLRSTSQDLAPAPKAVTQISPLGSPSPSNVQAKFGSAKTEGWGGGGAQSARSRDTPLPNPPPQGGRGSSRLLPNAERDAAIKEEFGDLLFVMANVARHLKIDPEACLRGANQKFIRRFTHIETRLAEQGRSPSLSTLQEMDALWDEAKAKERGG